MLSFDILLLDIMHKQPDCNELNTFRFLDSHLVRSQVMKRALTAGRVLAGPLDIDYHHNSSLDSNLHVVVVHPLCLAIIHCSSAKLH